MSNIKLLVCYHKPDFLLKDEIFTPIHVGRALAEKRLPPDDPNLVWMKEHMIGDNTGDNISLLNGSYNEMTALYWAWKNYDVLGNPDFIGLCHYRRHFVFYENDTHVYEMDHCDDPGYFDRINYSPEKLENILSECEFVCHLGKVDGIYKHFCQNHPASDLDTAIRILKEDHPEYSKYADAFLKQDVGNFCNMFIMPREMFFEYCEVVFGVMEKFCREVDTSEKRLFISERLSGVFIYKKIAEGHSYKNFPISFISSPTVIPAAYSVTGDNLPYVLTSVLSCIRLAKTGNSFRFYLMESEPLSDGDRKRLELFRALYPEAVLEEIPMTLAPKDHLLEISEKVRDGKLAVFTDRVVALQDLGEFYRTCNLDDYLVSATADDDDPLCVLNCARMRKYRIFEQHLEKEDVSPLRALADAYPEQRGRMPEWFVTDAAFDCGAAFPALADPEKDRQPGAVSGEVWWRPLVNFGKVAPWNDIQNILAPLWWDVAVLLPLGIGAFPREADSTASLRRDQRLEMDLIRTAGGQCGFDAIPALRERIAAGDTEAIRVRISEKFDDYVPVAEDLSRPPEDHRGFWKKIADYYRNFGFRATVRRVFEKLFRKEG